MKKYAVEIALLSIALLLLLVVLIMPRASSDSGADAEAGSKDMDDPAWTDAAEEWNESDYEGGGDGGPMEPGK